MESNFMAHYGIKGMKWGQRRSDAELSRANRSRNAVDLNKTKSALDETGKIIKSLKDIDDNMRKESAKNRTDIKSMSDADLKARVARLNLERNYASLTQPPVSKGRQHVRDLLEISGSVAAIGASSVAIALSLKQLKGA